MKQICILGSTGSIGTQALDVIEQHSDRYEVYCLTANNRYEMLAEQARKFRPAAVVIANEAHYESLKLLLADMQAEYEKGNYSVAGGDFNKDLLGNSAQWFGAADREYTWAQPLPEDIFDGTGISLAAPLDEKNPVPSCRNADAPYHEGQYVLTVDGFMVTPNVTVSDSAVLDTGFAYSDHNPVKMTFTLN